MIWTCSCPIWGYGIPCRPSMFGGPCFHCGVFPGLALMCWSHGYCSFIGPGALVLVWTSRVLIIRVLGCEQTLLVELTGTVVAVARGRASHACSPCRDWYRHCWLLSIAGLLRVKLSFRCLLLLNWGPRLTPWALCWHP